MSLPTTMDLLAHHIDARINTGGKENGFILMVFPAADEKRERNCHYIANIKTREIGEILEEQAIRFRVVRRYQSSSGSPANDG